MRFWSAWALAMNTKALPSWCICEGVRTAMALDQSSCQIVRTASVKHCLGIWTRKESRRAAISRRSSLPDRAGTLFKMDRSASRSA